MKNVKVKSLMKKYWFAGWMVEIFWKSLWEILVIFFFLDIKKLKIDRV